MENTTVQPAFENFSKQYTDQKAQIVYTSVISDLETPVSAYIKLTGEAPNSFLLESVEGGETLARYSIIGMDPDLIWKADDDGASINRDAQTRPDDFDRDDRPMLESFQALIDESAIELPDHLAPMAAGIFGYFGYDTVRETEHLPHRPQGGLAIPNAIFIRPGLVAIFDNIKQELTLATPVYPGDDDVDRAFKKAVDRLSGAITSLSAQTAPRMTQAGNTPAPELDISSNTSPTEYCAMVEQACDYIRAGDIFQVVLSQRFSTPFKKSPFSLYRSLRRENPSPFLFFLNFSGHALVGSSPEILVRVEDDEITIRPLAGTRPRGKSPAEDKALEVGLLEDPKERAEHLMLLDLGRNDVGRFSQIGSVKVTDSFVIERYSHVMHIVSNVTGQLLEEAQPLNAVLAGFPAGTVSGAPKVRAMQIIDELEKEARGPYAGAIGYFSAGGTVDTAITLRTGIVKDETLYVQAGAGIVADSDPQSEHQECINKAQALFSAAKKA